MIEKILNLLASISKDKLLHSYLCLIIVLVLYDVLNIWLSMLWSISISSIITIAIMISKEIYDGKHNCTHSVEIADVIAGLGGMILGLLLKLL